MDVLPTVALLIPPTAGSFAGYRTDGDMNEQLRVGARVGVVLTAVSLVGLASYGAYVLFAANDLYWPDVLRLIPVLGIVWSLFIGLYTVGTAAIGAVLSGYIFRERA